MSKFPPMRIDLVSRADRYQQTLYLGKIESPSVLYFKKGVAFFVFTSEPGVEELRIGKANPGSQCNVIKKSFHENGSLNRYHIPLERKLDSEDKPYFMAVVQDDSLELDLGDGYLFFVFTSKFGAEQIQIVKSINILERTDLTDGPPPSVEVVYQRRKESGVMERGVVDLGQVRQSVRCGLHNK